MAILKSCCCWRSVRSGSFASGVYTMIFYTMVSTASSFHVHTIVNLPEYVPVLLGLTLAMLIFAALSVICSAVLIVGLCLNNRILLLPWIFSVAMTTIVDVAISLYLITISDTDPFLSVLFFADFVVCGLNVYCLLCVTSQYQEYLAGRGRPGQVMADDILPAIQFEPASCSERNGPSPKMTISIIQNGGPGSSSCRLLAAPSSTTASYLMSRSSISSEASLSSDPGSSSRRSSLLVMQQRDRSDSSGSSGSRNGSSLNSRRGIHVLSELQSVCADDQSEIILVDDDDHYTKQVPTNPVISNIRNGGLRGSVKTTKLATVTTTATRCSPKHRSVVTSSSDQSALPDDRNVHQQETSCCS